MGKRPPGCLKLSFLHQVPEPMCPSYVNSASFSWWCPGHGFDLEFCPFLSKNFLFICTSNPDPKDKLVSRLGPRWPGGEKREKEKVKRKRGEKG